MGPGIAAELTREAVVAELRGAQGAGEVRFVGDLAIEGSGKQFRRLALTHVPGGGP